MYGRISTKLSIVTHNQVHVTTDDILCSKIKVTYNFSDGGIKIYGSPSRTNRKRTAISRLHELHYTTSTYTKFGERAFSYAGPAAWNSLPADLRVIQETAAFRRRLKTHCFNLAFNTI